MAPMTRRRSARLASNSKIPATTTVPSLDVLTEQPEETQHHEQSPTEPPHTPTSLSQAEPSKSEMHPSKANGPKPTPSSALRLGFADIQASVHRTTPTTDKLKGRGCSSVSPGREATAAMLQLTPSKVVSKTSPPFTFRFSRQQAQTMAVGTASAVPTMPVKTVADLGLSDEARRMMEELREEALQIRADLEVQREQENAVGNEDTNGGVGGRRIAQPKRRGGRFSAAHTAAFSKMDSIANHPSAFRASRTPAAIPVSMAPATVSATPVSATRMRGLKRTQSKANLDDTPSNKPNSAAKRPFHALAAKTSSHQLVASDDRPQTTAKRIKQNMGDDTSSKRSFVRDGSSLLPRLAVKDGVLGNVSLSSLKRSKTTASLLTPTKSLMARSMSVKTPSKTPSVWLTKSGTTGRLQAALSTENGTTTETSIQQPVFRRGAAHSQTTASRPVNGGSVRSALPVPMATSVMALSKTPAPERVTKTLPRMPATTPRRKLTTHMAFTPTKPRAVLTEHTPSLSRSGIPRSGGIRLVPSGDSKDSSSLTMDAQRHRSVLYPDLTGHALLGGIDKATASSGTESAVGEKARPVSSKLDPPASVPGTFTFRSDKTISFGHKSPTGFGSSPGQASIRPVRASTAGMPKMPGSFPGSSVCGGATGGGASGDLFKALVVTDGPNKENKRPVALGIIPHGIANKKRHRVSEAEEAECEAAERAAKKRRNEPVPEGEALLAPRLMGKKGGTGSVSSTPHKMRPLQPVVSTKKRPMLTMSRLNELARPKLRK